MHKKFFAKRITAIALASAMIISMSGVESIPYIHDSSIVVQAAENNEVYSSTETSDVTLPCTDWINYDGSVSDRNITIKNDFTMTADICLEDTVYDSWTATDESVTFQGVVQYDDSWKWFEGISCILNKSDFIKTDNGYQASSKVEFKLQDQNITSLILMGIQFKVVSDELDGKKVSVTNVKLLSESKTTSTKVEVYSSTETSDVTLPCTDWINYDGSVSDKNITIKNDFIMTADIYLEDTVYDSWTATDESVTFQGVVQYDDSWKWFEGISCILNKSDFIKTDNGYQASSKVEFKLQDQNITSLIPMGIQFKVISDELDGKKVSVTNVKLITEVESEPIENPTSKPEDSIMPDKWTFATQDEANDWEDLGWTPAVKGIEWDKESERLKMNLGFTGQEGWTHAAIVYKGDGKCLDMSPYKSISFELYYKDSDKNGKDFNVEIMAGKLLNNSISISDKDRDDLQKEELADGWIKIVAQFDIDAAMAKTTKPESLAIGIMGENLAYNGDIYFDNITFSTEAIDRGYVNSTEIVEDNNTTISTKSTELTVNDETKQYANNIKLVDSEADQATTALYQYLKAVGESSSVIYGHMEDTVLKAGSLGESFTYSDTADVTGSISAIDGLDCGGLFDGFAKKYVDRYGEDNGITVDDTTFADDVAAAAAFSNESIKNGAIITLSSHLPNFAYAEKKSNADSFEKAYDKYDYTGGDSYKLTGDCMNNILPGGKFNNAYISYLDLIADYAKQVDGPVLFRPLHENTGSWFWWGKAFCNAETYKSVFKYTVDYLRDEKGVHNFLYLYGPGSEAGSEAEYEERYPGDNYVDMVGFDSYDARPSNDESYAFMNNFENTIKLTSSFAQKHNKLFAVTETGISNGNLGLLPKNNPRKGWYNEILDIVTKSGYNCCYFMLWSNYSSSSSYYTPFVVNKNEDGTLFGHEMLDSFIKFYNDKRSIFASDQKDIVNNFSTITAPSVAEKEVDGYITLPVANSRILEATTVTARLNMATDKTVSVRASGNDKTVELTATKDSTGKVYTATLTKEDLDTLGKTADGKIGLYIDNKMYQEISVIFNIEEREMLPEQVDDFESYSGLTNLLSGKWATNNDSGCTISLSLVKDPCYEGEYALKFAYTETKTGWAGATIPKEADWSAYGALKFWIKPDGKNQKTVVQITTSGGTYEAYLNLYPEYANATTPLLVTLPFSEFKDGSNALTSEALKNMSSFGLWVNAIGDSSAFANGEETVSGELYYDDIRAVATGVDKPVFEVVGDKKPTETVTPSESKYTVTFDASDVHNATVSVKKNASEEFKSGDSVTSKDKLQLIITPADGYSIISAEAKVSENTCEVSEAEKVANGIYIITLSEFKANTKIDSLDVKIERTTVKENGIYTETNVGGASLGKTEFKEIQEDIKKDVISALKDLLNSTSTEQEKEKAQKAIDAINNNEAFIDIALKVDEKSDGITDEDEKRENNIKLEDIRKEVQKTNSDATVEVKTAITLDISLLSVCKYMKNNEVIAETLVNELTKPVKISMKLPNGIPAVKNGAVRTYYIICLHKNKNGKIESTSVKCDYNKDNSIISFDGSRFSTYVLCYADVTPKSTTNPSTNGSSISGGGTSVVVGTVTSTPTPVPTSTPGTAASTIPSGTPTPVPSGIPSATNTPSVTSRPAVTNPPADNSNTNSTKVKKGTKFTAKGINYKVTSVSGTKTVKCISAKKNTRKAVIPATVKMSGQKYKVTVIAKNAFKNNKKLTKVTVGKNIKNIGKNAFKGCKNLKKIIIKTKKLTDKKVGSKAFKGINSKAVVKVPKGKVKIYKKVIRAKGAGKKVTFKK